MSDYFAAFGGILRGRSFMKKNFLKIFDFWLGLFKIPDTIYMERAKMLCFYERCESMTKEERVASLHNRIAEKKRKRQKMITCCMGAVNMVLFVLMLVIIKQEGLVLSGFAGDYTGAMLFDNVGGYVLLAVVAFMLGVGVTVMCIYLSKKNKSEKKETEDPSV